MKVTQRGHHATRKTRQPLFIPGNGWEVGALKDTGEILELEVHMIYRMQVITEPSRPKPMADHCISAETRTLLPVDFCVSTEL